MECSHDRVEKAVYMNEEWHNLCLDCGFYEESPDIWKSITRFFAC